LKLSQRFPVDPLDSSGILVGHTEEDMGLGDNRRSPKMRRRKAQEKLKLRLQRRRTAKKEERAAPAAPAARPSKKSK
jgi:hypothetical protein